VIAAARPVRWARYPEDVSGEREELRRLVEELPDEQLPAALADLRGRLAAMPEPREAPWPPAFFNSIIDERNDLGRNHEDLLADGFGLDS
jgi:hypothetical protein